MPRLVTEIQPPDISYPAASHQCACFNMHA